jgi:hypothetical protein
MTRPSATSAAYTSSGRVHAGDVLEGRRPKVTVVRPIQQRDGLVDQRLGCDVVASRRANERLRLTKGDL